jgi:uncharacterized protein (TIGR04141 family)
MVVRLQESQQHFAFTFGTTGRHLLKDDAWRRAYGTRAALNIVFEEGANPMSILAVKTKRRGPRTLRNEAQSSGATTLETFGVDLFRDVFGGFTGIPHDDELWGSRVTGGDALTFQSGRPFIDLLQVCRAVDAASRRDDYRQLAPWIGDVQPVSEPDEVGRLQDEVVRMLREQDTEHLDLGPPEIIDWQNVVGFRLPEDRYGRNERGGCRLDLRLGDLLRQLHHIGHLDEANVDYLKKRHIRLVDVDGHLRSGWSIWRCLVGQFQLGGTTFVLDEGDFFAVDADYLADLNRTIDRVLTDHAPLPPANRGEIEPDYLPRAADDPSALLLHDHLIKPRTRTTEIEVCDILTADCQLIHVKRKLGGRDLSQLFAQGSVSAQLLQDEDEFRSKVAAKIAELTDDDRFAHFSADPIATARFEILYAIIADWRGRTLSEALPLFSKVNFRTVINGLHSRFFRVSCYQVPIND